MVLSRAMTFLLVATFCLTAACGLRAPEWKPNGWFGSGHETIEPKSEAPEDTEETSEQVEDEVPVVEQKGNLDTAESDDKGEVEVITPEPVAQDKVVEDTSPDEEVSQPTEEVVTAPASKSKEPVVSTPSADGKHIIHVKRNSFKFMPSELTIRVGDTVVWINEDFRKHNFISVPDGEGDPEIFHLAPAGDEWEHTFYDTGEYAYFCFIHSRMIGKVIVVE